MDKYEIIMRIALIIAGFSIIIIAWKLDTEKMIVSILKEQGKPKDTCLKWALLGVLIIYIGFTKIIF